MLTLHMQQAILKPNFHMIHYIRLICYLLPVAVLAYEQVYLDNIPSAESYEQSYMHRDVISHVFVTKYRFVRLLSFFA